MYLLFIVLCLIYARMRLHIICASNFFFSIYESVIFSKNIFYYGAFFQSKISLLIDSYTLN